ncbi:uncharacterized protein LOC107001893 [Solanum pennellii]|uniref:Uncharacterized protein LOC107001893 n=1 Tax=Solanum pennellii TaxID=28526 RepID=A0ABM1FDG6_SOLPN|nr:uncharacterized protein LOC107001893 [Solanum pennellii]
MSLQLNWRLKEEPKNLIYYYLTYFRSEQSKGLTQHLIIVQKAWYSVHLRHSPKASCNSAPKLVKQDFLQQQVSDAPNTATTIFRMSMIVLLSSFTVASVSGVSGHAHFVFFSSSFTISFYPFVIK